MRNAQRTPNANICCHLGKLATNEIFRLSLMNVKQRIAQKPLNIRIQRLIWMTAAKDKHWITKNSAVTTQNHYIRHLASNWRLVWPIADRKSSATGNGIRQSTICCCSDYCHINLVPIWGGSSMTGAIANILLEPNNTDVLSNAFLRQYICDNSFASSISPV